MLKDLSALLSLIDEKMIQKLIPLPEKKQEEQKDQPMPAPGPDQYQDRIEDHQNDPLRIPGSGRNPRGDFIGDIDPFSGLLLIKNALGHFFLKEEEEV